MQSTVVYPRRISQSGLLSAIAITSISIVMLFYVASQISIGLSVMLGIFAGLIVAMMYRIRSLDEIAADGGYQGRVAGTSIADGGSFHHKVISKAERRVARIVHDGGSHERSPVNLVVKSL